MRPRRRSVPFGVVTLPRDAHGRRTPPAVRVVDRAQHTGVHEAGDVRRHREPGRQDRRALRPGAGEQDLPDVRVGRTWLGVQVVAVVPPRDESEIGDRRERRGPRSDGDPVPVRLVLEAADGAGAGRLVDWTVLSAAEDAPTDG